MKKYKVVALAVSAGKNKVLRNDGKIHDASVFGGEKMAKDLEEKGFIKEVKSESKPKKESGSKKESKKDSDK